MSSPVAFPFVNFFAAPINNNPRPVPTSKTRSPPVHGICANIRSRCRNFPTFEYSSINTPPSANEPAVQNKFGYSTNVTRPTVN